jgi:hypothetical protein
MLKVALLKRVSPSFYKNKRDLSTVIAVLFMGFLLGFYLFSHPHD